MTKSLPERLREAVAKMQKDKIYDCCIASTTLYPDRCTDLAFCSEHGEFCLSELLSAIADEIECGYIKAPRVRSGEDGDSLRRELSAFFKSLSDCHELKRISLSSCTASYCDAYGIVSSFRTGDIEIKLTFSEAGKTVSDTLEAIEEEATLSPVDYCCKHANADISEWDASDYNEWMILDLLRRQREVLERDAEKPEERTCENAAAYFGDFECSECGSKATWETKYCPGCGAKVVG